MSKLIRTSLSIEEDLLTELEKLTSESKYSNRSEFIRDLIRSAVVKKEWENDKEVVGTITLIFDHHKRELSNKLTKLQHNHHKEILASTHIHLDHHMCAEMIMVKGKASTINEIVNKLRQQIGVIHAGITMSSTGKTEK
jgi:CopG family nickel-responsive transcriptional regulator